MALWYRYLVMAGMAAAIAAMWTADRAMVARKHATEGVPPPPAPMALGPWRGRDIPIDPREAQFLPRTEIMMRYYQRPSDPDGRAVQLTVVAARDVSAFHNPDSCFRGGGWSLVRKQRQSVPVRAEGEPLLAERLLVERDDQPMVVLYWYATMDSLLGARGHAHPTRLGVAFDALLRRTDQPAVFFRVVTSAREGEEQAFQRSTEFVRELARALDE
ncbi:MAG: EpsI family protein [Armatimonadetes bacterium]|nr:EpsI family protein [Armatimonadota bacterium]